MDDYIQPFVRLLKEDIKHFIGNNKEPYTEMEAWIDILEQVRWADDPVLVPINGRLIKCEKGQSLNSLETWATRWKWDKQRVRRYLQRETVMKRLCYDNVTVTLRITALNINTYKSKQNDNETVMKQFCNGYDTQNNTITTKTANKVKTPPPNPQESGGLDSLPVLSPSESPKTQDIKPILTAWQTKHSATKSQRRGQLESCQVNQTNHGQAWCIAAIKTQPGRTIKECFSMQLHSDRPEPKSQRQLEAEYEDDQFTKRLKELKKIKDTGA